MAVPVPSTPNDSVKTFRAAAERHTEKVFEMFPTWGTHAGRHEFDGELEVPSQNLQAQYEKLLRTTLGVVENLPEHDFGGDDWLDRRAFLSDLRSQLWSCERQTSRRNPDSYASGGMDAVYSLIVRRADDLTPVADAILARLKKIPAYLDSAADLIKTPVPLWQRLAVQSCEGAPSFFDAIKTPLEKTGKAPGNKIEKLVADAKAAYADYARRVAKIRPGPPGSFAVGKERFEALIRERLGWDLSSREALSFSRTIAARIQAEMEAEARRLSPGKRAHEILEAARENWKPERGDLLSEYQYQTNRVRETFREKDLVSFPPGEKLLVKPVPDFLRHHFPTAAYSAPGAYDPDQTGIFWVNDLSLIRNTEKEKRAEIRQHFGLDATCAHEAYPGHHLQFCTANRHPSKLRRLFAHAIFYEGWTLWCEQMMVDFDVASQPTAKLGQLHDALWRAHRILIDCGLQTGQMTYDEAAKHLMKHVGFTRGRAEGDVNWYTSSPTTPMSYLLGRTELLRVKRKKVDEQGWTVKQFNDWILSFGTLPWRWMEISGL